MPRLCPSQQVVPAASTRRPQFWGIETRPTRAAPDQPFVLSKPPSINFWTRQQHLGRKHADLDRLDAITQTCTRPTDPAVFPGRVQTELARRKTGDKRIKYQSHAAATRVSNYFERYHTRHLHLHDGMSPKIRRPRRFSRSTDKKSPGSGPGNEIAEQFSPDNLKAFKHIGHPTFSAALNPSIPHSGVHLRGRPGGESRTRSHVGCRVRTMARRPIPRQRVLEALQPSMDVDPRMHPLVPGRWSQTSTWQHTVLAACNLCK